MLNKYKNYIDYLDSNEYKKYLESLHIFFNNSPNQLCPTCNKGTIIKSVDKDGVIFMRCSDPKCDWNMKIIRANYVNLYKELNKKKDEQKELMFELLNTDKFPEVKKKYISEMDNIKNIDEIFKMQNEDLLKEETKRSEIFTKVMELYYKRKQIFDNIKNSLNSKNRNALLEIYKNEKNIKDNRLKQLSNQFKIDINDLKNILLWFEISFESIKLQTELKNINNNIEKYKSNMNYVNDNMMINLPSVVKIPKEQLKEIKQPKLEVKPEVKLEPKPEYKTIKIDKKAMQIKDEPINIDEDEDEEIKKGVKKIKRTYRIADSGKKKIRV